jgi:hypothetical protein
MKLTKKECEAQNARIFELREQGLKPREIANRLSISYSTAYGAGKEYKPRPKREETAYDPEYNFPSFPKIITYNVYAFFNGYELR